MVSEHVLFYCMTHKTNWQKHSQFNYRVQKSIKIIFSTGTRILNVTQMIFLIEDREDLLRLLPVFSALIPNPLASNLFGRILIPNFWRTFTKIIIFLLLQRLVLIRFSVKFWGFIEDLSSQLLPCGFCWMALYLLDSLTSFFVPSSLFFPY